MAENGPGGPGKPAIYDTDDFVRLYGFQDGWTADACSVPVVSPVSVERHFATACKQGKKGWAFKEESYVRKIMVNSFDPDPTIFLVRSLCAPSMKPGHYKQLVSFSKSAEIVQAHCNCVAGLNGTCQHMVGLPFALGDIQDPSSTNISCK
uniref:Putative isl2eu-5 hm n=1 Tax=Ixodes ricinus TaxID=34613 RepID=A0A6B0UVT7_IXORI